MQLFLILALLMCGGRGEGAEFLKKFGPVLRSVGGEEVKAALDSAEELSEIISAFGGAASGGGGDRAKGAQPPESGGKEPPCGWTACVTEADGQNAMAGGAPGMFPLEPVSEIADGKILYRLARYLYEEGAARRAGG